jgi:hypothetical protein
MNVLLAVSTLAGPGTAPEALSHCPRIVRDGGRRENGDHDENNSSVTFTTP